MQRQEETSQRPLRRAGRLLFVAALALSLAAVWIIGIRRATHTHAAGVDTNSPIEASGVSIPLSISLVVATDGDYYPMEYISNTQLIGHDIDLMDAIATEMGVTLVYSIVPWSGIFDGLVAGNYDAIINALTVTPEREAIIDFTLPYLDYEDEDHLAIAVQQGDNLLRRQINDALWQLRADGTLQTIVNNVAADLPGSNVRMPAWTYTSVPTDTESTLVFTTTQGSQTNIYIPSGAVTQTVELLYTPVDTITIPSGYIFGNRAFELDVYQDGTILLSHLTLSVPATITIHYSITDVVGIDENTLLLWRWNDALGDWEDAACGLYDRHPEADWLAVPICGFSRFAFFGQGFKTYLPLVQR